jgi:hypothetical protein
MAITYGSYTNPATISLTGLGYHFSTLHICTMRGDKILAFDDVGKLSLSLNGGRTYPIVLDLTGVCNIITRSKIYPNGNIMWASHTVCYYSTDNLATYHIATVLGIDGLTFVPSTYDNFRSAHECNHDVIINGVLVDIWGCYSVDSPPEDTNMNAWYTTDYGVTVKSCFKAGVTLSTAFQHVHRFDHCYVDDAFYLQVGDGHSSTLCHWFKGSYNTSTDAWTWSDFKSSAEYGTFDTLGMLFYNGVAYWGQDGPKSTYAGVYKCNYSDLAAGSYTKLFELVDGTDQNVEFFGDSTGLLLCSEWNTGRINYSTDFGVTWNQITPTGGPSMAGGGYYCASMFKNNDGYLRFEIAQASEGTHWTKGTVLMLRVK